MSGEDGINVILQVDDGAAGFDILGGQVSTTLNLQTVIADTTDKDGAGWQGSLGTTRSGDVSVNGILDATDAAWETLRAAWLAGTSESCELILNAAGDKWAGDFFVEALPGAGDIGGATTYDFTLKSNGVLTYTDIP
jgi:predicted secreted protein